MTTNIVQVEDEVKVEGEEKGVGKVNRREFLTYAWGAAMGVLALEGGAVSYVYMAPRFADGTQGGRFRIDEAELPALDEAPKAIEQGRFWLVNTADGPKAMYMVCTHLGCLYKWDSEGGHFGCPCHGSAFSKEGDYMLGPAPRSLDQFEVEMKDGEVVVNTGKRIRGQPREMSPAR